MCAVSLRPHRGTPPRPGSSRPVEASSGLGGPGGSRHRHARRRRNLASHDDLTGLPNRSLLHDRLGLAIAHAHRQASHLAVLFLDLDDFKAVNDLVTSADANMYRDKQGAAPAPSSEVASAIEAIARKAQGRVILPSR